MEFLLPPRLRNFEGQTRRVGFEIEFGGVSLEETCRIIQKLFGGEIRKENSFAFKVVFTRLGDFVVESDARFFSQKKYEKYLKKLGVDSAPTMDGVEKFLSKNVAGKYLPFEISMPPLPIDGLQPAEQIRIELLNHSAFGTHSSLVAAFGTQFNPEIPDFSVETLLSYMKAFFLLSDWLYEESEVSFSRQIAPFIHAFPVEYVRRVLDLEYHPSLDTFMRDYLEYNPTRNRPLDWLPLFTYMNHDLVFEYPVEKDMIKPRPTLHYRLPNSDVDDPEWSLAEEWNRWIEVEKLASQPSRLFHLNDLYLRFKRESLVFSRSTWTSITRGWIDASF